MKSNADAVATGCCLLFANPCTVTPNDNICTNFIISVLTYKLLAFGSPHPPHTCEIRSETLAGNKKFLNSLNFEVVACRISFVSLRRSISAVSAVLLFSPCVAAQQSVRWHHAECYVPTSKGSNTAFTASTVVPRALVSAEACSLSSFHWSMNFTMVIEVLTTDPTSTIVLCKLADTSISRASPH